MNVSEDMIKYSLVCVYTDVFVPAKLSTLRGANCFVTFLDDYNSSSIIKFINSKSQGNDFVSQMATKLKSSF